MQKQHNQFLKELFLHMAQHYFLVYVICIKNCVFIFETKLPYRVILMYTHLLRNKQDGYKNMVEIKKSKPREVKKEELYKIK